MRLLVAVALGAVASAGGWRGVRRIFSARLFARSNHRGVAVPVGAGVVLGVALIAADALLVLIDSVGHHHRSEGLATLVVIGAVLGFCILGLVDDLVDGGDDRGFTGHLRALGQGRLTTGGLKLVGGGLLALVVAGAARPDGFGALLVDAALIALAANAGNLFDRAPGRVIKVAGMALVAVLAGASVADRSQLVGVAIVLGAALGLLVFDLREQLMLGDAGSNVLGAAVGVGVVLTCGLATRLGVLVVVLALNLASERVSFSAVIDAVAPLRALDRIGRGRRRPVPPDGEEAR